MAQDPDLMRRMGFSEKEIQKTQQERDRTAKAVQNQPKTTISEDELAGINAAAEAIRQRQLREAQEAYVRRLQFEAELRARQEALRVAIEQQRQREAEERAQQQLEHRIKQAEMNAAAALGAASMSTFPSSR